VQLNCGSATHRAVRESLKEQKLGLKVEYTEFSDWDEFFIVFRKMSDTDLLILVSAREGEAAHTPYLDQLPLKLEKHFPALNKILIYP